MRNKSWIVAILLLAGAAMLFFLTSKKPVATVNHPLALVTNEQSGTAANSGKNLAAAASAAAMPENLADKAGELSPPPASPTNVPPLIILQNARRAIIQYAQIYGGNPVGTNPEITAALMGKNPKGINFITPDSGLQVNEQGEMLDAWGTPLFFHQISGHEMEIRSAGEDRKMWTFDDLITR
jgi:hypothetical protein